MNKKYIVRLPKDERQELLALVSKGQAAAYKIKHAHILLQADVEGPAWSDAQIAEALGCHGNTVRNVRQRWVEQGMEMALERKKLPPRTPKIDGHAEARLIALRCSPAPAGYARWSLRLLADKVVELAIVDSLSHETVRQVLKKMS